LEIVWRFPCDARKGACHSGEVERAGSMADAGANGRRLMNGRSRGVRSPVGGRDGRNRPGRGTKVPSVGDQKPRGLQPRSASIREANGNSWRTPRRRRRVAARAPANWASDWIRRRHQGRRRSDANGKAIRVTGAAITRLLILSSSHGADPCGRAVRVVPCLGRPIASLGPRRQCIDTSVGRASRTLDVQGSWRELRHSLEISWRFPSDVRKAGNTRRREADGRGPADNELQKT